MSIAFFWVKTFTRLLLCILSYKIDYVNLHCFCAGVQRIITVKCFADKRLGEAYRPGVPVPAGAVRQSATGGRGPLAQARGGERPSREFFY